MYRLRIRSGLKLEKSGKHSVFTVYFPVPSSKHCVLASEPENKQ